MRFYGARPGWQLLDLRELWAYREVLWTLVGRDLKVRYRQTVVGVAWTVLQPLSMVVVFGMLFGLLGRMPTADGTPYVVVALCGLLTWQLFSAVLCQATGSLVAHQDLLKKVYFPRLLLPLVPVATCTVDFGIGLLLLLAVMAIYGLVPAATFVFLPVFVLLLLAAAFAMGVWFAAANALYRDAGYIVPFILQVGFFVSPVIYDSRALIPERWRLMYSLNPMVGILDGLRWAILGREDFPAASLAISAALTAAVLVSGLFYFRRVERFVTDCI